SSCLRGSTSARARHGRAGNGCGSVGDSALRACSSTPQRSTRRSRIPITRTSWSEELTMARGRMINRKVATSEKVAAYGDEYGPWALVFHHRLIAFLDVNGCCRADPYWLKAEIFPRVSGI